MSDLLNKVLHLFSQKYAPAQSIADATDYLTTNEIHQAIKTLIPETEITAKQVFESLSENGYQFTAEPGKINFNLKWMLIKQY